MDLLQSSKAGKLIFLLLFLSMGMVLHGQKTEISGQVRDSVTGEVLPLVGVLLQGANTGVNTNLDGDFALYAPPGSYELVIRFSGYAPYQQPIELGQEPIRGLVIQLDPKSMSLDEVTITSKAVNPAHRIIRNAIKNRSKNRFDKINAYEYESYNKLVISMDNVTDDFFNKKLIRNVGKKVIEVLGDSNHSDTSKYKIAVFVSESISQFFYEEPGKKKEKILAVKTSGVKGSEYNLLSSMFLQLDIYDNNVVLVDRTFLSPIANGAFADYDYHLVNVESFGTDTLFGIDVLPKRPYDPVFVGRIYVDNQDWAINRLDLRLNEDPNINFVEDIRLRQEYSKVDTFWVPTLSDVEVDFQNSLTRRKGGKGMGAIGRSSAQMYNYKINQPRPAGFFNEELLEIKEDAEEHDSTYWAQMRRSPLDKSEQLGYALVDSLKSSGVLDFYINAAWFLTVGTKRFKNFEVGPYFGLVGFNQLEGIRSRLGVYTRPNFSKRWYLGGHLAYGWGDKRFKYGGEVRFRIKRRPKFEIGLKRISDVEQVGSENFSSKGSGLLQSLLRRVPLTQLNYYTENRLSIHNDMRRGLSGDFYFRTKSFEAGSTFDFAFNQEDGSQEKNYNLTEAGGELRVSFNEKYITSKKGDRVYLGTKLPILYIKYTHAFGGFLGGDLSYDKISLATSNFARMGRWGWLRYRLEVGQVFGDLPYPALQVFPGNQTWGYARHGFNLMDYYEFTADRYATAFLTHHFEGLLWNKLPLLRKLKFKEVIHVRAAYGSLSAKNLQINTVNIPNADGVYEQRVAAPNREPYLEAGVGLYNILKILRVDAIWRLNYHDLSYQTDPTIRKSNWGKNNNFGIRFHLNISL